MILKEEWIEWIVGDGRNAVVTISLKTTDSINADGHIVQIDKTQLEIVTTLDGKIVDTGYPRKVNHPQAVSSLGIVYLLPETDNRIRQAIREVESHPAWRAKLAAEEKALREERDYEMQRSEIEKTMNY